jgi:hypothetical protein
MPEKRNLDLNPFKPDVFKSPFDKYSFQVVDMSGRIRGGSDSPEKADSVAKTQSFFRPVVVVEKESRDVLSSWEDGVKL